MRAGGRGARNGPVSNYGKHLRQPSTKFSLESSMGPAHHTCCLFFVFSLVVKGAKCLGMVSRRSALATFPLRPSIYRHFLFRPEGVPTSLLDELAIDCLDRPTDNLLIYVFVSRMFAQLSLRSLGILPRSLVC